MSVIQNYPVPTSIKELQAFLGMVNFYHRFIPMAATHMAPLYQVLAEKPTNFLWNADQQSAFNHTKQAIAEAAILCYPQPGAPLILTDASDIAIGAVLETIVSNVPQPLSFYSRTLHKAERNYSTFDKELLAVHSAIRHFRHMLEGTQFTIQTDHRPLVTAFTKSEDVCQRDSNGNSQLLQSEVAPSLTFLALKIQSSTHFHASPSMISNRALIMTPSPVNSRWILRLTHTRQQSVTSSGNMFQ